MLVHAADRARDAVEIAVAGDAVARRLVKLHGDAYGKARVAFEPQAMPFVERPEVRTVPEHRLLDVTSFGSFRWRGHRGRGGGRHGRARCGGRRDGAAEPSQVVMPARD